MEQQMAVRTRAHHFRWLGLLATLITGVAAQVPDVEVPALLNTYRANPGAAVAQNDFNRGGTVFLKDRQVRERYFESFIVGAMQGEPGPNLRKGYPAPYGTAGLTDEDSYPWLARTLAAKDRMPSLPLGVPSPGGDGVWGTDDDGVYLYLSIAKLPTAKATQNVLNTLMSLGLLPGDPTNGIDAAEDAMPTGRWRVLIHYPSGTGAPPAPSVFYPEAVRLVTPITTGTDLTTLAATDEQREQYWNGFNVRYREWHLWVSGAYDEPTNPAMGTPADVAAGQEPEPFLMPRPIVYDTSELGFDRADAAGDDVLLSGAEWFDNPLFFNPLATWENRALEPNQALRGTADAPNAMGQSSDATDVYEASEPHWMSPANRPRELLIHAFDNASGGFDPEDATAPEWWVHGVNTVGPNVEFGAPAGVDTNALGTESKTGTNDLFGVIDGGNTALVLAINLSDRDGDGVKDLETVPTGIGMVELQFEYETYVPEADRAVLAEDWSTLTTVPEQTTAEAELKGANLLGDDGTGDDAQFANLADLGYDVKGAGAGTTITDTVLDPLDPHGNAPVTGTAASKWRVRRYCAWPFNPAVAGISDPTSDYQGGPIVCRFVVSPLKAIPEDRLASSTDDPAIGAVALYDPTASGHRYPQLVMGFANPLLEAANFLLGYRGEFGAVADLGTNTDYFNPVRPGSASENHKFFLQVVQKYQPEGRDHVWTPASAIVADLVYETAKANSGYPLAGPLDVAINVDLTGTPDVDGSLGQRPQYNSLTTIGELELPTLNHRRLLQERSIEFGGGTRADLGVSQTAYSANPELWDPSAAFDGNAGGGTVDLRVGYSVGRVFTAPAAVKRVDIWGAASLTATDVQVQVATGAMVDGVLVWVDDGGTASLLGAGSGHLIWQVNTPDSLWGVRVVNALPATVLSLSEVELTIRGDLRHEVVNSPRFSRDDATREISPNAVSDAAVQLEELKDKPIDPSSTPALTSAVKVQVPNFQRPSGDAIERQYLIDNGVSPVTYATESQPPPARIEPDLGANPALQWDRYRGQARAFIDDDTAAAFEIRRADTAVYDFQPRQWDLKLYRVRYRAAAYPASYQFTSWYEDDNGYVGAGAYPGVTGATSQLIPLPAGSQRVSLEPYADFDFEFSVALERKLRIAEKLVDFGKVLHGGVSQWVPVTLINEGNVPLRSIELFIEQPLAPISLEDRSSAARLAQMQHIPAWYTQDLAMVAAEGTGEAGGDLNPSGAISQINAAAVGSPQGQIAGEVYLRVGRLSASDPLQDRRVPVGQPIGNYSGKLRAFVDDLGLPGADLGTDGNRSPDGTLETSLGGAVTMKLTVQESPLWRIDDFYRNDVEQTSNRPDDFQPFESSGATTSGTFQPIPKFDPTHLYTNPDLPEATPTVVVVQDPDEFNLDPPNQHDALWIGWAGLRSLTGGQNWAIFYRDAARPGFMDRSQILGTNYRSFRWPAGIDAARLSADNGVERNLYPNVCRVPGTSGDTQQYVLLWHNEQETAGRRASYLQFRRFEGGTASTLLQIPDDASGAGLVNKQIPRAVVDDVAGDKVLWVIWQSGETGQSRLGFNSIAMPDAYNAAGVDYVNAIGSPTRNFVNYTLRTPPGLTNVIDPAVVPSYRNESTNAASAGGRLRSLNVLYSAWSPLWQNQDIYWSRYRAIEEPTFLPVGMQTVADGLRLSPMAEDAYRLGRLATHPDTGNEAFYVHSLPGGRIPFPRVSGELLRTNANHTVYAAASGDWVMPPPEPRVAAEHNTGTWSIEPINHRGFADLDRPLFDSSRYAALDAGTADPTLDPVVILRVFRASTLTGEPTKDPANDAALVAFDLANAYWDSAASEWVLPITGPAMLRDRGVTVARVHPGLGRVTFNKPLYRRGATLPIYVFATYRPCAWRVTTDQAVDSQPTAAFDWWERMTIVWRRTVEGGEGQLWYRPFSLVVPLAGAPVTRVNAVVNDDDTRGDAAFDGDATLSRWSFTGRAGGARQAADSAWSELNGVTTDQGFTLNTISGSGYAEIAQGDAATGWQAASMVHFGFDDIGRRVRLWYTSAVPGATNPREEAHVVPGFGPERLVPLDGAVNESQPSIAAEHFYAGYSLSGATERIMSTRFWLAWVSTRVLYVLEPTGPRPGEAGTNLYYGTFLPDFAADGTGP